MLLRRQILGFLTTLPLLGSPVSAANVPSLTPEEAAARVRTGAAVLVDVREPAEWKTTGVVATAHLLPLSDLRKDRAHWKRFLEEHRGQQLILYCRTGNRSGQAARLLAGEGFQVANAGGFATWLEAGQPTRKADEPPDSPPIDPPKKSGPTGPESRVAPDMEAGG